MSVQEPDLILGGSHLGRGSSYYDKDVSELLFFYFLLCNLMIFSILDFTRVYH